jgi:ribose transport system substrate-binding protein
LKDAANAGVKIVGIHSVAGPGPAPDMQLFTNITYDPVGQATLAADYAIADSKGKAQMIVVTDTQYAIARAKADAAQATIKACGACKMLDYVSTPVGAANQNMPGLFTSWIQKHPDPFYVYTVSDAGFFDPGVPALRTGGVPTTGRIALIGSDGSPAAYQRIKAGAYEIGTIPEPASLQGWQAIDELNRAIKGAPASGFVQPLHIITKENVATDINADGIYEPKVDYRAEYAKIWGK